LTLLVGFLAGCVSTPSPGSTAFSGVDHAAGISFAAELNGSGSGTPVLEVTITTLRHQYEQFCAEDECPDELLLQVRTSAMIDYRLAATAEASPFVVVNQAGATSSVDQVITFAGVEPGDHCIVVFSQILEVVDGAATGPEGMIGTYDHVTLGDSESDENPTSHCSTDHVPMAQGSFTQMDEGGCGGLPNGITSNPATDQPMPTDEIMVLVPTCQQDIVAVIHQDGVLSMDETRLVTGRLETGFVAYPMPRPEGRWRIATVPVDEYRSIVPANSSYWNVVASPPREFTTD
jgi:hypothetical protein